jgi:outer membrane protein, multidrug efflux system
MNRAGWMAGGLAVAGVLLSACASGPEYLRPDPQAPAGFQRAEAATFTSGEPELAFWQRFDDPLLTSFVEEALISNHDLRAALANLERARALYRHARFDRLPRVTAGASAADVRHSADQLPGATRDERDAKSYEFRVEAAWELDFLGRVRRSAEARHALAEATFGDLAALRVAVTAELVQSYLELRGLQHQLRVAQDNAENQARSLEVVQARLDAGRGIELDVMRARAQLEGTLALIPALEAEIAVSAHRISVLTGREPGALAEQLGVPAPVPALPARVPVGSPGELLRRRPDILAAERRLAAATARIGVATADLYPRFTLGGLVGSQAADVGDLFQRDSEWRLVALGIDWSFLDVGRVRARIAAADADAEALLANYQQTVLLALEETENAMVRYARVRQEQSHLEQAAAASAAASRLARLRFDGGAADFLHVLDAERAQLEAEDRMVRGRTRAAVALVALYRALAGGWEA